MAVPTHQFNQFTIHHQEVKIEMGESYLSTTLLWLLFVSGNVDAFRLHYAQPSQQQQRILSHLTATRNNIVGLEAPEAVIAQSEQEVAPFVGQEVDYVVIGAGIGGLSAAALLTYYGYEVLVLESHYLPGGCAHTFERDGFFFDAGPSLWNGMNTKPYNPLRQVLEIVGEADSLKYSQYDGWIMHIPEGSFKFKIGAGNFEPILKKFGGPNAIAEWNELNRVLEPVKFLAGAIPPLTLRSDPGVILTLLPHMWKLIKGAPVAARVEGPFKGRSTVQYPLL